MNEKILAGLKQLDLKTDAQWTQEGLVNLNAFKFVLGGESVTREQVEEVAPGFTRENAATYFDEKVEGTSISGAISEATISEATVTATTIGDAIQSDNVDTEEASEPNDKLLFIIKFLRGDFPVLADLSDEDLARYTADADKVRDCINSARDEFQTLTHQGLVFLNDLAGEVDRRTPVETLADQVKAIHFAQSNQQYIVDAGRQRVAPVVPPLRK